MAAAFNKNLEFMINIEHNLKELAKVFQEQKGQISAAILSVEQRAADMGRTLNDALMIQMTTSLQNMEQIFNKIASVITKIGDALAKKFNIQLEEMVDKSQEFHDNFKKTHKITKQMTDEFEKATKITDKKETPIKQFSEKGIISNIKKIKDAMTSTYQATTTATKDTAQQFNWFGKIVDKVSANIASKFGKVGTNTQKLNSMIGAIRTSIGSMAKAGKQFGSTIKILGKAGLTASKTVPILGIIIQGLQAAWKIYKFQWKVFFKGLIWSVKVIIKQLRLMAKVLTTVVLGPIQLLGRAVKWLVGIIGGLSFADAIRGLLDLDAVANDIARTMIGGVESYNKFRKAQQQLVKDIKESAFHLGASAQDMAAVYASLAEYHIPIGELKGLAELSYKTAKGLKLSSEQATQLVGTLRHIGKLSEKQITEVVDQFAHLQQLVGLSSSETQTLAQSVVETTKRFRAMGAGTEVIRSYTKATTSLAAVFIEVGLNAEEAARKMQDLFDPAQLENNIALYGQLGMSISDVTRIMQGQAEIPQEMAVRFVDLAKKIVSMGPIAGKAFAETMGMTYGMAQQLASASGTAIEKVNKLLGRTAEQQEQTVQEQLKRQREQIKEQLEMTRNRMQLMFMEALSPFVGLIKEGLSFLQNLLERLKPAMVSIRSIIQTVVNAISDMSPYIVEMINSFAELLSSPDTGILGALKDIAISISSIIRELLPVIKEIAITLADVFGDVVANVLKMVANILHNIQKPLMTIIQSIGNLLSSFGNLLNQILEPIGGIIQVLLNIASIVISVFADVFSGLMQDLAEPLKSIFESIKDLFETLKEPISIIVGMLKPFFDAIGDIFAKIADQIKAIIELLKPHLQKLSVTAGKIISKLMLVIGQFLETLPSILEHLQPVIDRLMGHIQNIANKFLELIDEMMPLLVWWLQHKIEKTFAKWEKRLRRGLFLLTVFQKLLGFIVKVMGGIRKMIRGLVEVAAWIAHPFSKEKRQQMIAEFAAKQTFKEEELKTLQDALAQAVEGLEKQVLETQKEQLERKEKKPPREAERKRREQYGTFVEMPTEEGVTIGTFKGMTEMQAETLVSVQTENNRVVKQLHASIQEFIDLMNDAFMKIQSIANDTRRISANTERIG